MDQVVVQFIQALRHHGLPISPAETLDALNAAALIGVADRERLKAGLGLTLAKNLAHRGLLDNLFDEFFTPAPRRQAADGETAATAPQTSVAKAADYHIQSTLGRQLAGDEQAALHLAIATAGEAAGVQDMRIFLQKNRMATKILLHIGDRDLQHELQELESRGQHLDLVADLRARRQRLVDRVRDFVEQQYLLYSGRKGQQLSEDTLRRVRLGNIDHLQQQQMARLVHKIAKKLSSLHSRRRKIRKRGLLDVRRTIAANAAFDGYLYRTHWKSTRVERPRLMVICDISRSVSQFSRFLLLLVYSLQDVLPRVRSFVFSNEMVEVTNAFRAYDLETSLHLILEKWGDQSTDYGRALEGFGDIALGDVDHKTQVIMLGDARNNYDQGRLDIWHTLCTRAQRVLWLNPEERSRWNTGDSMMREYGTWCSLVEHCSTLRDMERVLGRLLKYTT